MHRRKFIALSVALAGAGTLVSSCSGRKKIGGKIAGASASTGHLLRDPHFSSPSEHSQAAVVIVGAGVSGLSAARHLYRSGLRDFLLLELEEEAGGNARWGSNAVSAYPWGAHYIPTPNNDLADYLAFLEEAKVITGRDEQGLPVYNEQYLCFDPQERLYINGRWQDGLVPHFGVPADQQKQISRFLNMMDSFRSAKTKDGKDAFAIPIDQSGKDEDYTRLDTMTMKAWLEQNSFNSAYLHHYINYCTRDDFGTPYDSISAWMGIHYFASRKGRGSNAGHSDVLTWPEGNGFLVKALSEKIADRIRTACLATEVKPVDDGVEVVYYDTKDKKTKSIFASQCLLAIPQFVACRLLKDKDRAQLVGAHLKYTPWMVANVKVGALEERSGQPMSWDNVIYDSPSLGYVEATHEQLQQQHTLKNLSYYLPLTGDTPEAERMKALNRTHEEWVAMILQDLSKVHPQIEDAIQEVNVMVWGHAMAQPLPGLIHGGLRKKLSASIQDRIHFAHTDLAGASIFEEAFYQGLNAANKILSKTNSHV